MALTPEDVVNKKFQHVKFRDGYDQDEVDDFLDEVVVEFRRLYQENDELRQKLSAAEQRVKELSAGNETSVQGLTTPEHGGSYDSTVPAGRSDDPEATQAMPPAFVSDTENSQQEAVVAPESKAPEIAPFSPAERPGQQPTSSGADDSHGLLQLAQRLHDEHVAEGERTRDQLISEAEKQASTIVYEAEKTRDETLKNLELEKTSLSREIDSLQNFERQYRTRLKSYLSDQLRDLENTSSFAPENLGNRTGNTRHSL